MYGLVEEDYPIPGINTTYLNLYCPTHNVWLSTKIHKTQKAKTKRNKNIIHSQETK